MADTYFPAHNLNISSSSPDEREKEMSRRWRMGGERKRGRGIEKGRKEVRGTERQGLTIICLLKAHRIKTGFTSVMCRGGGTSEEVKSGGR